jgi:hypothetical protein
MAELRMRNIDEHLLALAERHGGRLTTHQIIVDAKKPSSPLHSRFEWNLKKAAYAHWVDTAQKLVSRAESLFEIKKVEIKSYAFIRDPALPPDVPGYRTVASLREDKVQAREALRQECLRAVALLSRTREMAAILGLEEEVEAILAQIFKLSRAA